MWACPVFDNTVKVPQIVKIVQAGSAKGLSYVATILELWAVPFTCTYNHAKGFTFRYSVPHRTCALSSPCA